MYSTDVNYLFYTILTEQVLLYSIFNINRFLRMLLMDYVILCGSNRRKPFTSVISTSNYLEYYQWTMLFYVVRTNERPLNRWFLHPISLINHLKKLKGVIISRKLKNNRQYNGLPFEGQDLNCWPSTWCNTVSCYTQTLWECFFIIVNCRFLNYSC
jgi:hypothetical protein